MTDTATLELNADLAALKALAERHQREYLRLRTLELAKLTGETPVFRRDRMTPEQLAALPDVVDSAGTVLEPGMKVKCPDGVRGVVRRVDRRSARCVVDRADSTVKMTVAKRLTVTSHKKREAVSHAA